MNEGWICTRCGKSLAPWVRECDCSTIKTYPIGDPKMTPVPYTGDPIPNPYVTVS